MKGHEKVDRNAKKEETSNALDISNEEFLCFCSAHDQNAGEISGQAFSFDDSFISTSGKDGGIFVWRDLLVPVTLVQKEIEPKGYSNKVEDIKDLNASTLQEIKLKSKNQIRSESIEAKKQVFYYN